MSARALIPSIGQVFEHVAHLLVPEADPEVLQSTIEAIRGRLGELRTDAFRRGARDSIERLGRCWRTSTAASQSWVCRGT